LEREGVKSGKVNEAKSTQEYPARNEAVGGTAPRIEQPAHNIGWSPTHSVHYIFLNKALESRKIAAF
jgi:hypothetical protein